MFWKKPLKVLILHSFVLSSTHFLVFAVLIAFYLAMKIMGGSTNMADGFKLARTSLFRSLTNTSLPIVFFVTDGAFSGEHPGKEITSLLKIDPAPTIIGIGIGSGVNVDQLRSILPGQQVFHMNDYSQLNKVIEPAIKIEVLSTPDLFLFVSF